MIADVRDQLLDLGVLAVDVRSLKDPRQKGRLPVLRLGDREPAGAHHDETGQVLVLRTQAVEHPGADARPRLPRFAAVHQHQRRLMIGDVGVHRADHADVVDHPGRVREQVADFDPALAVLLELEGRAHGRAGLALGGQIGRHRLAVVAVEHRLGVERVDVRRPAVHEQVDDPLGPGSQRRAPWARAGLAR